MPINRNASGQAGASALQTKSSGNYTAYDAIDQFRQAMQAAGIAYSGEIIPDGKLHRFHIEGHKQGTLNGAYTLHLDGCSAGWFKDWKTGIEQTWRSGGGMNQVPYALLQQINEAKLQREAEERHKRERAAQKAKYIWSQSKPITDQSEHAYLVRKHIQPHGARLYKEELVIPVRDKDRKIVSLEYIDSKGEKRFLPGGKKKGCFSLIGKQQTPKILICEGFATGATLYEETKQCVVVAFDAGNLLPVARNIRELSPEAQIIICGDNDLSGIGQAKAREAALAVGGKVLIPKEPGMDWNDAAASRGGYRHG